MQLQEFKIWVRRQLGEDEGCPSVKVELSDKQIEQSLQNAFEWFSSVVGIYREGSVTLVNGQSEYDVSSISPSIHEIVNAWFPVSNGFLDFGVLYPGFLDISGIPLGPYEGTMPGPWGDNSYPQTTIVQALQSQRSLSKWTSSDLDWQFYRDDTTDPPTKILRVMPAPSSVTGSCIFQYSVDPAELKLEWFNRKYLYHIKQWGLAEAKYILGRKRGKFSSVATAGGERQLDGEALIAESREDKQNIEEKVTAMAGSPLPLIY